MWDQMQWEWVLWTPLCVQLNKRLWINSWQQQHPVDLRDLACYICVPSVPLWLEPIWGIWMLVVQVWLCLSELLLPADRPYSKTVCEGCARLRLWRRSWPKCHLHMILHSLKWKLLLGLERLGLSLLQARCVSHRKCGILADLLIGKLKRLPNWAIAQFVALPKNWMDWRKRV